MIERRKSQPNIAVYLITACMVLFLFSINWNTFIQPSGIVYWRADVDPPSYEAITLQCLSNKGLMYIAISSVLLLAILVILLKQTHQKDNIQSDLLLLWGMATIAPLLLWSLSSFLFQRKLPTPQAVSMLIAFNDQFRFLVFLFPMIVAQYITGMLLRQKTLGRIAVCFALISIPVIVSVNFNLDENNIQQGDQIGRVLATCFRFILPLMLAVCSWATLKAIREFSNTSDCLVDHRDNTTNKDPYLIYLGILWFAWGCVHLAIHFASIQTIANAYDFIDGPLIDGTFEWLNVCFFCMIAFVVYRKHQRREADSIQSRRMASLWTIGFFAVMLHEEMVSMFIRSIAYDTYHVCFLYLSGATFVSVLPLLMYASCLILRSSHRIVITLSSLACSVGSFLIPCMIEQPTFHIATNGLSLVLPPLMLMAVSLLRVAHSKRGLTPKQ
ncbi:MAG: hypothetical protein J6K73_07830 [Clostridia bacterium]|nr:hypothetical protein [Clostridia bacterium]